MHEHWRSHATRQHIPELLALAVEANILTPNQEPLQPLPQRLELNADKVALGEKLFHEPRFSRDNTIACASCHNLATGGVDQKMHSTGVDGAEGSINAPTVFNSGYNLKQFWDGRAETLEEQIDGPLQAANEMGARWSETIRKLQADPIYASAFSSLYPEGVTIHTIKDAIATFESSLSTPDSRFDRFLRGEPNVLSAEEMKGYDLFKAYGCVACHQGMGVGGNMFQTFGIMADYFAERGNPTPVDLGRFNVTKDEQDRHVFKVPSLRNVALTPPYFHDGSAKRLEDAVAVMARYQLGRHLPSDEIALIVKFLRTLTGEYKGRPLDAHS